MELGDVRILLRGSKYEPQAECLVKMLAKSGVTTTAVLDNAPALFGPSLCRHNIWELVAYLRDRVLNPPLVVEEKPVIERVATPKKKRVLRDENVVKVEDKGGKP